MQISGRLRSTGAAQKLIWFSTALMMGQNDQAQNLQGVLITGATASMKMP